MAVSKTVEYRRAEWLVDQSATLEDLVRDAWSNFDSHIERAVAGTDGSILSGLKCDDDFSGFCVHCAKYVDQQGIGTVPMEPASDVELGEKAPDEDTNFLKSDLFALIRGDHVVSINAGRNAAQLSRFLRGLIRSANSNEEALKFELLRVASLPQMTAMQRIGVKKIDMNVSLSQASALALGEETQTGGWWSNVRGGIADTVSAIISRDDDVEGLTSSQKGNVNLSIAVPKGDLDLARDGLNAFAEAIAEDDDADGFVIELRNGQVIRPNEVTVKKVVSLRPLAGSVSVHDAFEKLDHYMVDLFETGQIEA